MASWRSSIEAGFTRRATTGSFSRTTWRASGWPETRMTGMPFSETISAAGEAVDDRHVERRRTRCQLRSCGALIDEHFARRPRSTPRGGPTCSRSPTRMFCGRQARPRRRRTRIGAIPFWSTTFLNTAVTRRLPPRLPRLNALYAGRRLRRRRHGAARLAESQYLSRLPSLIRQTMTLR